MSNLLSTQRGASGPTGLATTGADRRGGPGARLLALIAAHNGEASSQSGISDSPRPGSNGVDRRRGDQKAQLVALIAAHNEEQRIGAALKSLSAQSRRPDLVIVIADRCSDRTAEIAASCGATVFETSGNRHRKAGALNQALKTIMAELRQSDQVLLMDADTILSRGFLESAELRLMTNEEKRAPIGAVGGVFLAPE